MRSRLIHSTTQRRRPWAAALALAGFALLGAALTEALGAPPKESIDSRSQLERVLPPPDALSIAREAPAPTRPVQPRPAQPQPVPRVWKQMAAPVRLTVPAIGLSAPVIPLGRNDDGTIQTPDDVTDTGWFTPGPEPGEKGAAVIVGHVDSYKGPGVFYRLRALQRGDRITVVPKNGRRLQFVVTGSKQAAKDRFPTELVFARTDVPTLRLVTCGGTFDRSTRHYLDNYIVFARLVGQP